MSKMAPQVGPDITERIFMPRFAEMCTDALFHVRKVIFINIDIVVELVFCVVLIHNFVGKC